MISGKLVCAVTVEIVAYQYVTAWEGIMTVITGRLLMEKTFLHLPNIVLEIETHDRQTSINLTRMDN